MTRREVKKVLRLLRKISDIMGCTGNDLRKVGKRTELEFLRLAERSGFAVDIHTHKSMPYDFVVNGHRVQVKHRRSMANGTIDLCFNRRAGASRKAYLLDEFDVLAVRCDGDWYLIPASILDSGNGETLVNNIAPSKYAEYINNWGVFTDAGVRRNPAQTLLEFGGK